MAIDLREALEHWFFKYLSGEQRTELFRLAFGQKIADEAGPIHAWQKMLLRRLYRQALASIPVNKDEDSAKVEADQALLRKVMTEPTMQHAQTALAEALSNRECPLCKREDCGWNGIPADCDLWGKNAPIRKLAAIPSDQPVTSDGVEDVVERVAITDQDREAAQPFDRYLRGANSLGNLRYAFAKHRHAALSAAKPVPDGMVHEAEFLCARLREFERDLLGDDVGNLFNAHVLPPLARLEDYLDQDTRP